MIISVKRGLHSNLRLMIPALVMPGVSFWAYTEKTPYSEYVLAFSVIISLAFIYNFINEIFDKNCTIELTNERLSFPYGIFLRIRNIPIEEIKGIEIQGRGGRNRMYLYLIVRAKKKIIFGYESLTEEDAKALIREFDIIKKNLASHKI